MSPGPDSWVALSARGLGPKHQRPCAAGARDALARIVRKTLWVLVGNSDFRTKRSDRGLVLAMPPSVPREIITMQFVDLLRGSVEEHCRRVGPSSEMMVQVALHVGRLNGDGQRSSELASTLADSEVLDRALCSFRGARLGLLVSTDWYDAVIREGYVPSEGYGEVWVDGVAYTGTAWACIPGHSANFLGLKVPAVATAGRA
jgi:hypothetical protein